MISTARAAGVTPLPRPTRPGRAEDRGVPTDHLCAPAAPLVDRFLALALPQEEWTHEAHLAVASALLRRTGSVGATVDALRALIPAHNDRVGLAPGHRGYHETLTRYYVGAVARSADPSRDPACARRAPARLWTAEALASDAARVLWLEPDRRPLPWPASDPVTVAVRAAATAPPHLLT